MRNPVSLALVLAMSLMGAPLASIAAQTGDPATRPEKTGDIVGKVTDIKPGQDITVQLRDAQGQLVGKPSTLGAAGEFTFSGLNPGIYTVQIVQGTNVVPITVTVAAGQTATVTLSAAALSAALGAAGAGASGLLGMSTTLAITTITIGGLVIGSIIVAANQNEASPSR